MPRNLDDALVRPEMEKVPRSANILAAIDTSTSTEGTKNNIINHSMLEGINSLKDQAKKRPEIPHYLRCILFASDATWHVGPDPVLIEDFIWKDVSAGGATSTGKAIHMMADALESPDMPRKNYPPVLILISDGANTDGDAYEKAIARLESTHWGAKAIRLAIGVGGNFDRKQLEKFSNQEVGVLEATSTVDLANYIKYALTTVVDIVIKPNSVSPKSANNAVLPPPPAKTPANGNPKMELF